jgi:hypothetical protein
LIPNSLGKKSGITNKHHYAVDCFNDVIDWLAQELDSSFSETTSQLLVCSAAFNPRDSFYAFDGEALMRLAKLYLSHPFLRTKIECIKDSCAPQETVIDIS